MTIISEETISKYQNADDLINFIAANRYNPENQNLLESASFSSLPDYAQYTILILDFETEYEMQGLFTTLDNEIGQYLPAIAQAFNETGNSAIANHLNAILDILPSNSSTAADGSLKQYDIGSSSSADNDDLSNKIAAIDTALQPLILEKDFWDSVNRFISYRLG